MNVPPKLLKKSKFGGTFRYSVFLYLADCQCDALSIQRFIHGVHSVGLGFLGNADGEHENISITPVLIHPIPTSYLFVQEAVGGGFGDVFGEDIGDAGQVCNGS